MSMVRFGDVMRFAVSRLRRGASRRRSAVAGRTLPAIGLGGATGSRSVGRYHSRPGSLATTVVLMAGIASGMVGLGGCGKAESSAGAGAEGLSYPYAVTTTVGMVTDIVRQVAGEHAEVTGIIGSGVDPHLYKPTRNDLVLLHRADIVFNCGLKLEGKMEDTLERVGEAKPVHAVTKLIDPSYLLELEDYPGHYDPHVWMDVSAWARCVEVVAEALSAFDPAHAEEYRANAGTYIKRLDALHAYGKECIATIPGKQRVLITSHDAFSYFGRAYGLEVRGVQGISTESEAGLHDINALVDFIVERGISAVFVETSVAQKNIRALIEGAASRDRRVQIGGELFSDAMGEAGTYEGTYIGMLDHNITTVTRALGGEAPARGLNGKLTRQDG